MDNEGRRHGLGAGPPPVTCLRARQCRCSTLPGLGDERAGRASIVLGLRRAAVPGARARTARAPANERSGDRATPATVTVRVRGVAVWLALTGLCLVLAQAGEAVGFPAPQLVIATVAGAVTAALRGTDAAPARGQVRACHALVGVLMGSYLQPEALRSAAGFVLSSLVATAVTIILCVLVALLLARVSPIATVDAVLGLAPGGSASIIASATDLGADSWHVAFAQYLRVALVALTAPLLIALAAPPRQRSLATAPSTFTWPDPMLLVQRPDGAAPLLVLTAVCVLGPQLGARLRLPAPALLGSAVLTVVVVFTDTATGFAPSGLFRDAILVATGLEVGFHFSRTRFRHTISLLPHLAVAIVSICVACGGIAWAFSAVTGVSLTDAYLATTPGGITAVLGVTASTDAGMTVVSTAQCVRLFVVAMVVPVVMRGFRHREARTQRRERQATGSLPRSN